MSSLPPPTTTTTASSSASKLPPFDISRLVTQAILPQSTSTYEEIRLVPNPTIESSLPSESHHTMDPNNEEIIIVEETTTTNVDNTIVATIASNESVNGPCSVLVGDVAVVDDDDELLFSGSQNNNHDEDHQQQDILSENTGMANLTDSSNADHNYSSSALSVSTSPAASGTLSAASAQSSNHTPRLTPRTVDTELESISTMTTVKTTSTTKKVVKRHSSLSAQTMDKAMDQAVSTAQQQQQTSSSSTSTPQKQSQEEEYTTLQSTTPKKKQKNKGTPGSSSKQILGNFFKSLKGYLSRKNKKSLNQSSSSVTNTSAAQSSSGGLNQSSSSSVVQASAQQNQQVGVAPTNDAVYFNPSLIVTQAPNPKNTSTHSISTTTQSETVDDAEIIRTTTTTTTTLRRKSVNDEAASSSDNNLEKIEIETEEELQTTTTTVTTKKKRKKPLAQSGINAELTQQQQQHASQKSSHKHIPSFSTTPGIKSLLPPQRSHMKGKKTLVLDLDETLVHSVFVHTDQADFVMPIEMDGRVYQCYVLKRPGVDEFLREMGKYFEIVIFTASLSLYANPLLDILDKHGVVEGRLFREHCTKVGDTYIKDLSKLGRDLDQTIIVDNSPSCYALHPQNALAASTWYDDPNDRELYLLADCLTRLEREKYVYDGLRAWKELISSNMNAVNVAATCCGGSAVTVSSTSHHHKVIKKRL